MKWDDIELRWPDLRQRALVHWFHLTAEDVNQMTGKREELIECVRERYKFPREQAEKEVDAWAFFLPKTEL
jgi:hypothetical protein